MTLARAVRRPPDARIPGPDSLARALVDAGVLTETGSHHPADRLEWDELARDLTRARALGLCLPSSPVGRDARRRHCRQQFGLASPGRDPDSLAKGHPGRPDRAQICLLLADLAGDGPRRPSHRSRPTPRSAPAQHPPARGPGG